MQPSVVVVEPRDRRGVYRGRGRGVGVNLFFTNSIKIVKNESAIFIERNVEVFSVFFSVCVCGRWRE